MNLPKIMWPIAGVLFAVDWKDVVFLTLYAFDFVVVMLLLALWRFHTKEVL